MSELIKTRVQRYNRRLWLATSSVLVLAVVVSPGAQANDDDDGPTVWIELGGQLERVDGNPLPFVPSFSATAIDHGLPPPASVQNRGRYGFGGEAAVVVAPRESEWELSASVRYGRSNSSKSHHQQTKAPGFPNPFCDSTATCIQPYFTMQRSFSTADNRSTSGRNTVVVDFEAGKDVGLGLFGSANSRFDLGIRFAQFTASSALNAYGIPYPHWERKYSTLFHTYLPSEHSIAYHATANAKRSFSGFGPTVTWRDSVDLISSRSDGRSFSLDWSINAAVLFGRQKAKGHFRSEKIVYAGKYRGDPIYVTNDFDRSRSVIVPNLGGQAALSLTFPNAKVTFGYRADFFFGAMDGGIETRRSNNLSFHGPFATISVGLGG